MSTRWDVCPWHPDSPESRDRARPLATLPVVRYTPPEPRHDPVAEHLDAGRPVFAVAAGRVVGQATYSIAEQDADWWGDPA